MIHGWIGEKLDVFLTRIGAARSAAGFRVEWDKDASPLELGSECHLCGGVRVREVRPSGSLWTALMWRSLPKLGIGVCEKCLSRLLRRWMWAGLACATSIVFGVSSALASWVVFEWLSSWTALLVSAAGGVVGFFVGLLFPGRLSGSGVGLGGNPAHVVATGSRGWIIEVASDSLAQLMRRRGVRVTECRVVERDVFPAALGGLLAACLVGGELQWYLNPWVRVVNVTDVPMVVEVDGREVAVMSGVVGEQPGAGRYVQMPRGFRVLRARGLDGVVIDETRGVVGEGRVQLYAPGSVGRCFWVERRAYGGVWQPKPEVVELSRSSRLHTLAEPIDGWFEPNPDVESGRWLSGGMRRVVRQGQCR